MPFAFAPLALLLLSAGVLTAQVTPPEGAPTAGVGAPAQPLPEGRRTMTAVRLQEGETIELDGLLDEPVWQRAVPATDFIQQDPIFGGTPTEQTEVRIVFDGENLYMSVLAYDSEPDRLMGNTMKRDEFLSADDRFMWTMDPFFDQQTGYFFEMNPSGLMADALMGAGGGNERAWDGIWDAYALRHDQGYTIEIEIPFRTLNFDPNAPAWGINFQRTIRRKNEEQLWTGHERNQGLRRMSNAGLLLGITGVSQGHGLDVRPYATATTFDAPGDPDAPPRDTDTDFGVDLFYNLTPDLRANLTVNTDFAQTEVDQRLVNLTRFPVRYPEQRDFFLEGSPFFSFASSGVEPFFSRRIGLDQNGVPQDVDVGGKLTGRAGAQDIGFLQVRTGEEARGDDDSVAGEDFSVLRVKRRVLTQSYVGSIFTLRHARDEGESEDRHTAGADFRLVTSTFRGAQNLSLSGFLLWSTKPASPTDPGDPNNLAYGFTLDYPNEPWSGAMSFAEVQPDHDPAVGFVARRGFRSYLPSIRFGPRPAANPWVRQLTFSASGDVRTNMDNDIVTRVMGVTPLGVGLHSGESANLGITHSYERLERDFPIQDGVILPAGSDYTFTRYRLQVNTASQRVLSTSSFVEIGDFFSGTREQLSVGLGVRPMVGVVANLSSEWNRVTLPEGDFQKRVYRGTLDTQFNPWIYVVNNLQYDSVTGGLGWQIRFRWTVDPGNELYFVYTQNWLEDTLGDRFLTQDRRGAAKAVYTYRW